MFSRLSYREFVAPQGQQVANNLKNLSQSTRLSMKIAMEFDKNKSSFIHIARVYPSKIVQEVSIYRFNKKQQLIESIYAEEGNYINGKWLMKKITKQILKKEYTNRK